MLHQRAAGGLRLTPLLVALWVVLLLPTLATGNKTETIKSNQYEMKELKESSMLLCLTPLEGGAAVDAKLRLEVVPKALGGGNLYLAGNADVPNELLQKVSGTSLLRYEYTTINQKVALKVTLNNEELPFSSYEDMNSDRYELNLVKLYIRGHVQVTYNCHDPAATTTTATTTTTTTLTSTPTTTTTTTSTPTPTCTPLLTVDPNEYKMKELNEPSMGLCLTPLEGDEHIDAEMKFEIVRKRYGEDDLFPIVTVEVPKDRLQQVSGASLLRYEYTTNDRRVVPGTHSSTDLYQPGNLTVTLNNEVLPYTSYLEKDKDQYEHNLLKFYIKGRVAVTKDCPEQCPTRPTERPAGTFNIITTTTDSNHAPPPPTPPTKTHKEDESWVYVLGAAGPMPTLVLLLGLVAVVVVVAVPAVILRRRKNRETSQSKVETIFADEPCSPTSIPFEPFGSHELHGKGKGTGVVHFADMEERREEEEEEDINTADDSTTALPVTEYYNRAYRPPPSRKLLP